MLPTFVVYLIAYTDCKNLASSGGPPEIIRGQPWITALGAEVHP